MSVVQRAMHTFALGSSTTAAAAAAAVGGAVDALVATAAAEVPPVGNLQAFLQAGGDLVIFSGGKDIAGPNDSGILCGRGDLIAAARAQAFPNGPIGRPLKVSKE